MRILPVVELFHSIQGEGTRVGEPATFVRFAGCNLRCTWCDTPYSWSVEGVRDARRMSVDEIAHDVRERSVVLTGGEPMLHRATLLPLLDALRARGVTHVTVETNATLVPDPELARRVDLWSLSPKLPASGERTDPQVVTRVLRAVAGRCQLKFVIAGPADLPAMWQLLSDAVWDPATPLIVQPDGMRSDYGNALRELTELVVADTDMLDGHPRRSLVRVVPQTHRVAWGVAARGV